MLTLTLVQKIAVWLVPVLLAVTLHEAAHAYVAYCCGDSTAKRLGRLSFNPIRHIDLIGTIVVPFLVAFMSHFQFIFGWAKPVPIYWSNLRHPRRDTALVAAAGPIANIVMALLWALCLKISIALHPAMSLPVLFLWLTSQAGILINVMLAIVNLLPIPPLDGSRMISSLLPLRAAALYAKLEPFGIFILLLFFVTGALNFLLSPILSWSFAMIKVVFNL